MQAAPGGPQLMGLVELLNQANGWLKHAESKHAVLIGLNGAAITAILGGLGKIGAVSQVLYWWALVAASLLFLAVILALLSFSPVLRSLSVRPLRNAASNLNPYYFAHVAMLEPAGLLEKLSIDSKQDDKQAEQIASQVITNSRIALRKFRLFEVALDLDVLAAAPPFGLVWLMVQLRPRKST